MKVALKIGVYNKEFESLNHLMSYDSSVWFDNLIFLSLWWNYFNKQTFIIYWDIQSYCACLLSLNTKENNEFTPSYQTNKDNDSFR